MLDSAASTRGPEGGASDEPTADPETWVRAGLETTVPLMHVELIGRKIDGTRRTLTTVLRYRKPRLARLLWSVAGFGHRMAAPQVLTSLIATTDRSGDAQAGTSRGS